MKGTRLINRYSEKNFHFGKWAILGPNMVHHPNNSGSALRMFFKILLNEKGQQVDENDINIFFRKIFCLGQLDHFGPKNGASS